MSGREDPGNTVASVETPPWDPEKDRQNRAKHGIGFDEALEVVEDPLSRTWPDRDPSGEEPRWIVAGHSSRGRFLCVVVAMGSEGKMRIISARRATKRERHAYEAR